MTSIKLLLSLMLSLLVSFPNLVCSSSRSSFSLIGRSATGWQRINRHFEGRTCDLRVSERVYALELLPKTTINFEGGEACPRQYVMHTDENRMPTHLAVAKCKCVACQLPVLLERYNYTCLPIYHMVPVMRRSANQSEAVRPWYHELERIVVGCKCRRCLA